MQAPQPILRATDLLTGAIRTLMLGAHQAAFGKAETNSPWATGLLGLYLGDLLTLLTNIATGIYRPRRAKRPNSPQAHAKPSPRRTHARLSEPGARGLGMPNHRGWMLKTLPGIAHDVADSLRACFDHPDVIALIAAFPRLREKLRPLQRGLDLPSPPIPKPPTPTPPAPTPSPTVNADEPANPPSTGPAPPGRDEIAPPPQNLRTSNSFQIRN